MPSPLTSATATEKGCRPVAKDFAEKRQSSKAIARVLHAALPSCPGHMIWQRDFAGASAVFSIVLEPEFKDRIYPAMSRLRVFAIGAS